MKNLKETIKELNARTNSLKKENISLKETNEEVTELNQDLKATVAKIEKMEQLKQQIINWEDENKFLQKEINKTKQENQTLLTKIQKVS